MYLGVLIVSSGVPKGEESRGPAPNPQTSTRLSCTTCANLVS